jgi:tripeptidyl-peptidase-1
VSALGEGYQVVVNGKVEAVGGTSASCPAFAGMVSLLNAARLAAGGKQMGFLNPWLYANADAFTSIDIGSDKFGRGGGEALAFGYNCTKGWDPATGLGTPLFEKLLAAATK